MKLNTSWYAAEKGRTTVSVLTFTSRVQKMIQIIYQILEEDTDHNQYENSPRKSNEFREIGGLSVKHRARIKEIGLKIEI